MLDNYDDFKSQIEKDELIPLCITNSTIEYGPETYPTNDISHIKLIHHTTTTAEGGNFGAVLLFMGLIALLANVMVGIVIIILGLITLILIIEDEHHKFYEISFTTSSGNKNLFFSEDKVFVNKVKDLIKKAMKSNEEINCLIQIRDKNIIDNNVSNNHTPAK